MSTINATHTIRSKHSDTRQNKKISMSNCGICNKNENTYYNRCHELQLCTFVVVYCVSCSEL